MECITYRLVAYFSMEIALENSMPTYSGGLGVLAGDTIRAAADLRLPMVAVSLLYRKGYFSQRLEIGRASCRERV
jgi:starch phosphorylase